MASVTTRRSMRPRNLLCFYGMIGATVVLGTSWLFHERVDPSWPITRSAPKPKPPFPTATTLAAFALTPLFLRAARRNRN